MPLYQSFLYIGLPKVLAEKRDYSERFTSNISTHLCAEAGVAVVFVQELPGTGICGATQWLNSTKALIQLSLRYKTDDQLWFTFFHEAGHILLHGKRHIFLDLDSARRQ